MKVLAIGNSFSQDATHYLHRIAAADGVEMKVSNLFIGGYDLAGHYRNILADACEYEYEENGQSTGRLVSIRGALESERWDVVVTQQASHFSGQIETYFPCLEKIAAYIKEKSPAAELLLHETWAYEKDSDHGEFYRYENSQKVMYDKLSAAYREAAAKLGVRLIPCGDAVQILRTKNPFVYEEGGMSLCRDGFHMSYLYGRYLLAAVWYRALTGRTVAKNAYIPSTPLAPSEVCDERALNVIKETVDGLKL